MQHATIRPAAVAGQFYPDEPRDLKRAVDGYIAAAGIEPAPERVTTIVSPHAGYMYSGPTAGHAFARVRGKAVRRVILIGSSHRYLIETASVYTQGEFQTPLGTFPIDEEFATRLAIRTGSHGIQPHMLEHSLEVQLPFVAEAVGLVPIVPVLFGAPAGAWHAAIGEALAEMADEHDLVIASTDLSHCLDERHANEIDRRSIDMVLAKDWRAFAKSVREPEQYYGRVRLWPCSLARWLVRIRR